MFEIAEIKKELSALKSNASNHYQKKERPKKTEAVLSFLNNIGVSVRFILTEKENILFAFLSLAVIGLGYFLGIQILEWVPQDVWDRLKEDEDNLLLDIVLLVWSFVCVGLVAYPLGIFTACMGASYILRFHGRESTILECLKIVMSKSWTLWIFSWLDGWWTFLRILERLPKKNDRTPLSVKLRNEAVYQAWKIASLGFLPALVYGRGLVDSCKDSISLLRYRFGLLSKLRIGYSIVCWIVGISAYIGMFFMLFHFSLGEHEIYSFYFMAGVPIVGALVLIMLVFRPIYIISACRIYAFYAREKEIEVTFPETSSRVVSSLVAFLGLLMIMAVVFIYRDEVGLSELIAKM